MVLERNTNGSAILLECFDCLGDEELINGSCVPVIISGAQSAETDVYVDNLLITVISLYDPLSPSMSHPSFIQGNNSRRCAGWSHWGYHSDSCHFIRGLDLPQDFVWPSKNH